jgi:hypothetical protein
MNANHIPRISPIRHLLQRTPRINDDGALNNIVVVFVRVFVIVILIAVRGPICFRVVEVIVDSAVIPQPIGGI